MPIICEFLGGDGTGFGEAPVTEFVGAVVEVNTFRATRNLSDTLDYSDWQTVPCRSALAWCPECCAGVHTNDCARCEAIYHLGGTSHHFGFRIIDISNHFSWRNGRRLDATVDADLASGTGVPGLWVAWDQYQQLLEAERAQAAARNLDLQELRRVAEEQERAKAARREQRLSASKDAAHELASRCPVGSVVTHNGKRMYVWWSGATKYRGKFVARVGLSERPWPTAGGRSNALVWVDAAAVVTP